MIANKIYNTIINTNPELLPQKAAYGGINTIQYIIYFNANILTCQANMPNTGV